MKLMHPLMKRLQVNDDTYQIPKKLKQLSKALMT